MTSLSRVRGGFLLSPSPDGPGSPSHHRYMGTIRPPPLLAIGGGHRLLARGCRSPPGIQAYCNPPRGPSTGLLRRPSPKESRLHVRFRPELRRQISAATCAREALREQGKLKRVIASILQKDTDLYALHSLQLEQGIPTDAPAIHNMVKEQFKEWYRAPGPSPDWPSLLTDRLAFQALADSKGIPTHLTFFL